MKQLVYVVLVILFFACSNKTEKKSASNEVAISEKKSNENYKIILNLHEKSLPKAVWIC